MRAEQEFAALEQAHLWFSKLDEQNDDLEKLPWFERKKWEEALAVLPPEQEFLRDIIIGTISNFNIHQSIKETSICCFSDTPTNEHLWSHYAGIGGICIKYATNILAIDQLLRHKLTKVRYVPDRSPEHILGALDGRISPYYTDDTLTLFEKGSRLAVSTKTKQWAPEREWRFITNRPGARNVLDQSIDTVFIDDRCELKNKEKILHISKIIGFQVCFIKISNRTYKRKLISDHLTEPRTLGRQFIHVAATEQIIETLDAHNTNAKECIEIVRRMPNCDEIISVSIGDDDIFISFVPAFFPGKASDIFSCRFQRHGNDFDLTPLPA